MQTILSGPLDTQDEIENFLIASGESYKNYSDFKGDHYKVCFFKSLHPGVADYVQNVLNKQFSDIVDLYVGIVWNSVSSEIQRNTSETVEKFDMTHSSNTSFDESTDIMFCFRKQLDNSSKDEIGNPPIFN